MSYKKKILVTGSDGFIGSHLYNTKGKQLVGWETLYGGREGFKPGLAETAEWFMNPANLVGYKSDRYTI